MIMNLHMAHKKVPGTANIKKIFLDGADITYNDSSQYRIFRLNGVYYYWNSRSSISRVYKWAKDGLGWEKVDVAAYTAQTGNFKCAILNGYAYIAQPLVYSEQGSGSYFSSKVFGRFNGTTWQDLAYPPVWDATGATAERYQICGMFTDGNAIFIVLRNQQVYKYNVSSNTWTLLSITYPYTNESIRMPIIVNKYVNTGGAAYMYDDSVQRSSSFGMPDCQAIKFTESQGFIDVSLDPQTIDFRKYIDNYLFVKNGVLHVVAPYYVDEKTYPYYKIYKYMNSSLTEIAKTNPLQAYISYRDESNINIMTDDCSPEFWFWVNSKYTNRPQIIYELIV